MQQSRKILGLKPVADITPAEDSPETGEVGHVLRTAMAMKVCVAVVYNRMTMRIAPHILYTRHGEPFMDGVVLEREGQAPKELKLGSFKLVGLGDVRLTAHPFTPSALFDVTIDRYAGATLHTIRI